MLEEACQWIAARSPMNAAEWYNRFVEMVLSLAANPQRCGLAPESQAFDAEIRQLIVGRRGGRYRAIFTIQEGDVHILHIRHTARTALTPEDLEDIL